MTLLKIIVCDFLLCCLANAIKPLFRLLYTDAVGILGYCLCYCCWCRFLFWCWCVVGDLCAVCVTVVGVVFIVGIMNIIVNVGALCVLFLL